MFGLFNTKKPSNEVVEQKPKSITDDVLNKIDEIRQTKTVWDMMGLFNYNEIISWGCPFMWSLNPDDRNPGTYRCYVDSGQVSLIDVNLYFDDGTDIEYKRKYKKRYNKYLNDTFKDIFGENHGFNVNEIS